MKICYAIIAFDIKKEYQLCRLIDTLNVNNNVLVVFIDKKSDELFNKLQNIYGSDPNIHFVSNRINIYWGDLSQVNAYKETLEEALKLEFDYFTVLSESCLPLYSDKVIKNFLQEHMGTQYIDVRFDWTKRSRLHLIHDKPYTDKQRKHRNILAFKDVLIDTMFGWLVKHNNTFSSFHVPTTTCWFTVTKDCLHYIYNQLTKGGYIEKYKNTLCCDEHIYADIIYNSPYYNKIQKKNIRGAALVYCDWYVINAPKLLSDEDLNKIYRLDNDCPYLYARKFDYNVYPEVIETIYKNRNDDSFQIVRKK